MILALVGGHFLADFAGQGQFMSDAKNITKPIPGIPWWWVLFGHATIHGMVVGVITNSALLGLLEIFFHFTIDLKKCLGKISFLQDQINHIACKALIFWLWCVMHSGEISWTLSTL